MTATSGYSGRFDGRVVLVTGAGRGIGRAVALAFCDESAALVLVDQTADVGATAEQIRHQGRQVVALQADLGQPASARQMVETAISHYGRLDIACNNAGIAGPVGTDVASITHADWQQVLQVNLSGVFFAMQNEIAAMRTHGGGAIVNTASVGGLVGAPGSAAYCASKHGVIGLTRAAALDAIEQGIRINAVCPGATETEMLKQTFSASGMRERLMAGHPIGRIATPSEIARTVLFLASEEASFIVGQALAVDGGVTAH